MFPSLLSSRMLNTDRLAMARRLQFFVQSPDVHESEQEAVAQGVVQPLVVHGTVQVLLLEECGLAQKPFLQSDQLSLYRQLDVSGVLQDECA